MVQWGRRSLPIVVLLAAGAFLPGERFAHVPGGRSPVAAPSNSKDDARDAGWRGDVDSLVSIVRQRHWRYRDAALPAEFLARANALRAHIPKLSDDEIVVQLQAILATLHDGHSLIFPFGMKHGALAHLPIALYEFRDGLAVIATDSAHSFLRGRQVLRISGVSSDSIPSRLAPLLSLENESQLRWAYPLYATLPSFLRAIGTTKESTSIELVIRDEKAQRSYALKPDAPPIDPGALILGLIPPPTAPAPLYLTKLASAYWFTALDDGGVLYLQMNRVTNDSADPLDRFSAGLLDSLERPSTRALIVDLRNNNGGNAAVLPPIIRSIVAFRALHATTPMFVLIGRQTFSAAQTLVNRLEEYCDPIFVGEETGSKPNRFGNGAGFHLPYSGVSGEISTGYNQAATSRDVRTATAPTIRVAPTLTDWLAGRDVALDSVRKLIRTR